MDTSYSLDLFEYELLDDDQLEPHELVDRAPAPVVRNDLSLDEWRAARADAVFLTAVGESLRPKARTLLGHMMRAYDGRDGSGMYRSPRKLAKELGAGFSEKTIRRLFEEELVEKGACWKERRTRPSGHDSTNAYHVYDELLPEGLRCVSPSGWSTPMDPSGWSNESTPSGWSNPTPALRLVKPALTNHEALSSERAGPEGPKDPKDQESDSSAPVGSLPGDPDW